MKDWKSEWFYAVNALPGLEVHGVDRPQPIASWTKDLTADEKEQIKPHLLKIQTLKNKGLNGIAILANFIKRRVQPLKD